MAPRPDAQHVVAASCGDLVVHRWGDADGRPVALLSHGTGFCGSVWAGVAEHLRDTFTIYALDRRGHGRSAKPADAYDFAEFADDAVRVVDALGLHGAYGIGHSAGATDLLLASVERPAAFARMFVVEPTAMDPRAPHHRPELAEPHQLVLDGILRRSARFASRAEVVERYRTRDAFAAWRPDLLEAYVEGGFHELPEGGVALSCAPQLERAMLVRIFAVMEGRYGAGRDPHPFAALASVPCPTVIATTALAPDIYGQMAQAALATVPGARTMRFDGVGHTVAQCDPDAVAAAALAWWDGVVPNRG